MSKVETVVLAEIHRVAWIKTILAITGTGPQRRAFINGYNGEPMPRYSSSQMRRTHELGALVRSYTKESDHD